MNQEEKNTTQSETKNKSRQFLVIYIIGLFSIALVLILLSYLTQVRANKQMESLQTQVTEQKNVAQGAQQQMTTLQETLQQQQKRIDEMTTAIQAIRSNLEIADTVKVQDGVDLLKQRYIALDSLQQVRRGIANNDMTSAKAQLTQMIDTYTLARLLPDGGDDAVLLGQNAIEFQNDCAAVGIDTTIVTTAESTTKTGDDTTETTTTP